MTYDVFGGTLNLAQLNSIPLDHVLLLQDSDHVKNIQGSPLHAHETLLLSMMPSHTTTARVLASQAEAIVRTGKTWPQATRYNI